MTKIKLCVNKYLPILGVRLITDTNTLVKGLEIGGKTGTANMIAANGYERKYISSFCGFANDKEHKYTIGVMVKSPISTRRDYWSYYYASNSAVPVVKEVVEIMAKQNYFNKDKY